MVITVTVTTTAESHDRRELNHVESRRARPGAAGGTTQSLSIRRLAVTRSESGSLANLSPSQASCGHSDGPACGIQVEPPRSGSGRTPRPTRINHADPTRTEPPSQSSSPLSSSSSESPSSSP